MRRIRVSCLFMLLLTACGDATPDEGRADAAAPDAALDGGPPAADAAAPDAGDRCSRGETCDGTTGLCESAALCTPTNVCEDTLVGLGRETVTEPLTIPTCRTTRAGRGVFDDGAPRTWTIDGITRAACIYTPPGAAASPRPLVIYLHGAGGSASAVYDSTSLRGKATTFDLGGDGVAGFVLASHQGRNQENENGNPPASRHDVFYRRFEPDTAGVVANADARSLDTLIDDLVREGVADPARIYLMAWSNGAFFSQEYALFRTRTPTPDGHRIAAVVAFDGGDPFQSPRSGLAGCELLDVPRAPLPVMLIHRACSVVGCDATQSAALRLDPGFDVSLWADRLNTEIGARVTERIVGGDGTVGGCAPVCGMTEALVQHIRWPDGVADRSGIDHEVAMLEFLRDAVP